ncbi:uncharacterized protein PV09_01402 [Verruconis gallopava]|uniref:LysM domain-containing protein n=1 Tax=Verruconis gallopava TaxID=253628 RepID=A0A0D2APC5_9PEZI|nr:uncharacterized protein PV09_01402 [Verruconis gallopava]KIW08508.1 hypothetical protein PV09_01402 [Verruconis gallopava]
MTLIHLSLLAACSFSALVAGLPLPSGLKFHIGTPVKGAGLDQSFTLRSLLYGGHSKRSSDTYTFYTGNGETWPGISNWVSNFDDMFAANKEIIMNSCSQFGVPNNSEQETADISSAISQVAGETGIDARFILAIMLQESNGCVRAPTTNYGVRNPGLMQDHNGQATCNDSGNVQNPCPAATITQMIRDGVAGTPSGDGLEQTYAQAPFTGAAKYYGAARIYNSGSIAASGNLDDGIATHCYASDVANRLTGWVYAQKDCTLDGTPPPAATPPATTAGASPTPTATYSPATATAVPSGWPSPSSGSSPSTEWPSGYTGPASATQPATQSPTSASSAPPTNLAPGVTTQCAEYYTVQAGDECDSVAQKFGTTFANLRALNTQLDSTCSNLWKGYAYCVKGA